MQLFTWTRGRQQRARYFKYCFLWLKIGRWGFDGYILAYPKKCYLPPHKDTIDGKMWRINIQIKGLSIFWKTRKKIDSTSHLYMSNEWINVFRPDIYTHALLAIKRTYKLSIGIAHFNKKIPK